MERKPTIQYGETLLKNENRRTLVTALVIAVSFIVVLSIASLSGKYYTSPSEVVWVLLYGIVEKIIWVLELPARLPWFDYTLTNPVPITWSTKVQLVLLSIRMPRVVGALLIGVGVAICGANYQSVFKNPLVSESILGVSAGACFGAMLAVVMNWGSKMTYLMAFLFAVGTVFAVLLIGRTMGGNQTLSIVLVGTILSAFMSSCYSIMRYIANPITSQMSNFMFWLMGSCSRLTTDNMCVLAVVVLVCGGIMYRQSWRLNLMSMGDEHARSLGVNTTRVRNTIIICATLITAVAVSISGVIGWIGLVIPQMLRMTIGSDNRKLMPCAFFGGGIYLVMIDMLCRVPASGEVPVGVLSAMVGTPFFLLLLIRQKTGWS